MTYSVSPDPELDKQKYTGVLPDALLVELPIPCVRCGYTLSGLKTNSKCPECALPIANSVFADRLEYADASYLRSLVIGARLAQLAPLAMLVFFFAVWLLTPLVAMAMGGTPPMWLMTIFNITLSAAPPLCMLAWLAGWWLLTPPTHAAPPGSREHAARVWVRRVSIVEAVAVFLLSGLFLFINITAIPPAVYVAMVTIAGPALMLAILAHLFFAERYLTPLARRGVIRNFDNKRSSHRTAWVVLLAPLSLSILGAIAQAGPILQFMLALLCIPIAIWLLVAHMIMLEAIRRAAQGAMGSDETISSELAP